MRVAIAGLANSHPYTDARLLRELADAAFLVWEPDAARREEFLRLLHDARPVETLAELLEAQVDAAVVTRRPAENPATIKDFLRRGVPVFANKPAVVTAEDVDRLDAIVRPSADLFMSTSVLRFAPAFEQLLRDHTERTALSARVTVRHDVGRWTEGSTPWQDDPGEGGGMLVTMGVHGVELLVALFGTEVVGVDAYASTRFYRDLLSEDVATIDLRWTNGIQGTVEVLGVAKQQSYELCIHEPEGDRLITMPGESSDNLRGLGYRRTIESFLGLIGDGVSPVPWEQTHTVLKVLAEARGIASSRPRSAAARLPGS